MAERSKTVDRTILSAEVSSPYSGLFKFFDYMPNPDELLKDRGETLGLYKRMLLDPRIYSLVELRKSLALSRSYSVICEDTKMADFIYGILEKMNIREVAKNLLSALEYGFSVCELIWKIEDGLYVPHEVKLRDPERFSFDYQGRLYWTTDGIRRRLEEPYKFIAHRHGGLESPYGSSILKQCYWPWMFKNAGFRFWMITAEKFGVPTVIAIFESDDEQRARERARELAEALSGIQSDAAVALGNVKEVDTLEVKGNLESFKTLIDACDNQIAYAITGQSLASAEAQYGTRAQAEVHERMFQAIAIQDAINLAHTLNDTLISWIVELNFGSDAKKATFTFDTDEYAPWEVVKEAIEAGVPVSKKILYLEYGIPEPEDEDDAFISPKNRQIIPAQINLADYDKKKLKRPYLRIS